MYGLTSSILSGDTYKAFELAPKVLAGIVNVNSPTVSDEIHAPMGGVRDSGWGRTGPRSLEDFSDLIWINSHSGQLILEAFIRSDVCSGIRGFKMSDAVNDKKQYDYIVVGAGAAGCVLAADLSASGTQVLVVESGGPDDAPTIMNPSIWFYNVVGPLDYHLPITPSPQLNNRKFSMALGYVLGGAPASMPWCGCAECRGIMTGGQRTEPGDGPSPTCFRCSRVRKIGKAARMKCGVLVAPYRSAVQKIPIPQRQLFLMQPAKWACRFWTT
jgi:hypothetical protein